MTAAVWWFLALWFLVSLVLIFRALCETARSTPHISRLCEMADEDIDDADDRYSEYAWLIRAALDDKDKMWPKTYA